MDISDEVRSLYGKLDEHQKGDVLTHLMADTQTAYLLDAIMAGTNENEMGLLILRLEGE